MFNWSKDDWKERVSVLVEDLHTLEVNTIEKPGMTARRMPPTATAVAEIAEAYRGWLLKHMKPLQAQSAAAREGMEQMAAMENATNRVAEFDRLTDLARGLADAELLAPSQNVVCQRIWRNSAYLSNLTAKAESLAAVKPVPFVDWLANPDAPPGAQLPAEKPVLPTRIALENLVWIDDAELEDAWRAPFKDRAKIRKIWEVGVEVVLVQTAIQLEGDVITRISPRLTSGAHIDDVMKIHQHSIETSMKMWSRIVDTVARLPKAFGL